MFMRTNILLRKFHYCSISVKEYCLIHIVFACMMLLFGLTIFQSLDKFCSCYNRCLKLFFGYKHYDSVMSMLSVISLPSFETVLYNSRISFINRWHLCALYTEFNLLLIVLVCFPCLSRFMCVFFISFCVVRFYER